MSFSYMKCEVTGKQKTNADKYLKDGVDLKEIANGINEAYLDSYDEEDLVDCVFRWFSQEVKPSLTKDEKVILRNIVKKYELIGRDERLELGKYNLYIENINYENEQEWANFDCFNDLFQFIQPRRRI